MFRRSWKRDDFNTNTATPGVIPPCSANGNFPSPSWQFKTQKTKRQAYNTTVHELTVRGKERGTDSTYFFISCVCIQVRSRRWSFPPQAWVSAVTTAGPLCVPFGHPERHHGTCSSPTKYIVLSESVKSKPFLTNLILWNCPIQPEVHMKMLAVVITVTYPLYDSNACNI